MYGFPALSTLVSSSSGLLYLTPSTRGSRIGRAVCIRELDAALQIQIVRRAACGVWMLEIDREGGSEWPVCF
jgi:hypothetical protein